MTAAMRAVGPPLALNRPMLPLAVKRGLLDATDWRLTMIVALSFLAHFGFVGSLYSDWADPIVEDSATVQALVDLSHTLPPAPIEEERAEAPSPTPSPAPTPAPSPAPNPSPGPSRNARRTSDPTAGLVNAAEEMRLGLLATTAPGSPLDAALKRSNIPAVSLDHADAPVTSDSDLSLHSAGPVDPSKRRTDLTNIVSTRSDANGHVVVTETTGPQLSIDARPIQSPIPVSNAERTISNLRSAFRRCYELGLQRDPTMTGDATIRVKIRATGEVDGTSVMASHGLSSDVTQCIARKIELAQFDSPKGGPSTIDVPVKMYRQGR